MKYLYLLICLGFFASCDEDEDDAPAPSKKELLTAGVWVFDTGGVDANNDGTAELPFSFLGVQPCLLDNRGTFYADNTGLNDEGPTKCNAALPQSTPFTWQFTNNEANLNIAGSGFFGLGGEFKILALTSSKLTLSRDTTIAQLGSVALVATLKH